LSYNRKKRDRFSYIYIKKKIKIMNTVRKHKHFINSKSWSFSKRFESSDFIAMRMF